MSTLLLRLEGPMQSWGTQSRYDRRDTGLEPSKSGVIGLLCAALGRGRDAPVDDLAALRMGVRADRSGSVKEDYQTAGGSRQGGERNYGVALFGGQGRRTVITRRHYLADASFLVGLEGITPAHVELLRAIDEALRNPVWPIFLGRRAYVPSVPVRLPDMPPRGPSLRSGALEDELRAYPWPGRVRGEFELRLVLESADASSGESRMDVPISFAPLDRRYRLRYVETRFVARGTVPFLADLEEEQHE